MASLAAGARPARFVIVDDGWQSVTPDAAYRKKVDHISDHPGVALRERRTRKRRTNRTRDRDRTSRLFRQKKTSRPESKAQTSANGGPGGRARSKAQNASPHKMRLRVRRRTRRPRRRRARPPRATLRIRHNDGGHGGRGCWKDHAPGARHAVRRGGVSASAPSDIFARQVAFAAERIEPGVDRGAPRQRPHRERDGRAGRQRQTPAKQAHIPVERASASVVADARGGGGGHRDGLRFGSRVLARRALQPVPRRLVALVPVPGPGRVEPVSTGYYSCFSRSAERRRGQRQVPHRAGVRRRRFRRGGVRQPPARVPRSGPWREGEAGRRTRRRSRRVGATSQRA